MEHEPFTEDDLDDMVLEMLDRRRRRLAERNKDMDEEDESPFMRQLRDYIGRRAPSNGQIGRLPTE